MNRINVLTVKFKNGISAWIHEITGNFDTEN